MRSTINTLEPLFSAPSVLATSAQQSDGEDELRVAIVTFARRIHFYSANLASTLQLPVQVSHEDSKTLELGYELIFYCICMCVDVCK